MEPVEPRIVKFFKPYNYIFKRLILYDALAITAASSPLAASQENP
jgi:hypothetical protein